MVDEKYRRYIKSDAWKQKREQRLKLDNHTCVMCKRDSSKCDLQVHHINYKNLGHEELNDLCTVCGSCHRKIHNYYNRSRVTEAR